VRFYTISKGVCDLVGLCLFVLLVQNLYFSTDVLGPITGLHARDFAQVGLFLPVLLHELQLACVGSVALDVIVRPLRVQLQAAPEVFLAGLSEQPVLLHGIRYHLWVLAHRTFSRETHVSHLHAHAVGVL